MKNNSVHNENLDDSYDREDNYALDDTLAGRVVQAGFAGAALSLPDYVKKPKALITTYILLLGSFAGLVGYLNAIDEEEEASPQPPAESSVSLWQLIAGLGAIGGLKILGLRKLAQALYRRGGKKPWAIFGGIGAGVVFAASEYAARRGQYHLSTLGIMSGTGVFDLDSLRDRKNRERRKRADSSRHGRVGGEDHDDHVDPETTVYLRREPLTVILQVSNIRDDAEVH